MSKHNLLIKKVKRQFLSINDLIESNFNKLKYFKSNYKKILLIKENRLILGVGATVILTLSYFLIPTFYNKDTIQSQLKNQILKNYGVQIKFNEKIIYGLLPKPHFSAKNLSILRDKKEIAVSNNLKIFIDISKFFSKKVVSTDLVFNKTDFNLNLSDFIFFKNLLKTEPNENEIYFKKSNIFFKNNDEETLFINKINYSKFFYDSNNLQNVLSSKNEVFNVPFKLIIKNDKFNKKIFSKFSSKKIRLNIDSETDYDDLKTKKGLLDILFINKNTSLNYEIKKNSLNFQSEVIKNFYKGLIDFKPFYLFANFNYEGLSSKNLFNDDSIFFDLIQSEILNNKNLNANLNFKVKDITNIDELNNLNLNIAIEEGDFSFSNSYIMWKEDLKVEFEEGLLTIDDEGIKLVGTVYLNFKNISKFYSSFQIPKKNRKQVEKIQLDFIYNFNDKGMKFDNPKVDGKQNPDLEELLGNFNNRNSRIFNKVKFKNFVNSFFSVYAG